MEGFIINITFHFLPFAARQMQSLGLALPLLLRQRGLQGQLGLVPLPLLEQGADSLFLLWSTGYVLRGLLSRLK
jgi:hypothetical protein